MDVREPVPPIRDHFLTADELPQGTTGYLTVIAFALDGASVECIDAADRPMIASAA
jgi:hypothetical protein